MTEFKSSKVKPENLSDYVRTNEEHLGSWDISLDGVVVGRIEKWTHLQPVCRNGAMHVTNYRKITEFKLAFKQVKDVKLNAFAVRVSSLKEAIGQFGAYRAGMIVDASLPIMNGVAEAYATAREVGGDADYEMEKVLKGKRVKVAEGTVVTVTSVFNAGNLGFQITGRDKVGNLRMGYWK